MTRARSLGALLLAAVTLAGCAAHRGPAANCFSLLEGGAPCDFQPLPDVQGSADARP